MTIEPEKIEKVSDDSLRVFWTDGHVSLFSFRLLRQSCPCALCKDEWSGARLLDPDAVPETLKASRAELVGNYALAFAFSDGHTTGVYTYELLRRLCPCAECAALSGPS